MHSSLLVVLLVLPLASAQDCPTQKMNSAGRKSILDRHNALRSSNALGKEKDNSTGQNAPSASNMYKMVYDCELERIAQAWADRCEFNHSPPNVRNAGENLFMRRPTVQDDSPLVAAADSWWGELTNIGVGKVSPTLVLTDALWKTNVGHYTQMAWATSTQLGCGHAKCPTMNIVVCNYRDQGNMMGQKIYEAGPPCAKDADCTAIANSRCSVAEGLCIKP